MSTVSASENLFNVLIIGGGPIGIACALECKKKGLDYFVMENGALTNSIYNYPLNMTFFSTSEKLEINDIPFINNPKPNRNEALEYYRRVVTTYRAKNIILSTGFYDIQKN